LTTFATCTRRLLIAVYTTTDIHVVTLRHKAIICPQSATGMFWLQVHFEDKDWKTLSEGSFLLSRADAAMMIEDAQSAGLIIKFD
jgi:hypothetical protein